MFEKVIDQAVKEQEEDLIDIRVTVKHDTESEEEEEELDEVTKLRNIIVTLKERISDYEDRENIPLEETEEVEEERRLNEVVTQTNNEGTTAVTAEADYYEQMAAKIEREHK